MWNCVKFQILSNTCSKLELGSSSGKERIWELGFCESSFLFSSFLCNVYLLYDYEELNSLLLGLEFIFLNFYIIVSIFIFMFLLLIYWYFNSTVIVSYIDL